MSSPSMTELFARFHFRVLARPIAAREFDPDGRRLAFKRNEVQIVVIDQRTGAARSLPARASWPGLTWTADGKSLLFSWFGQMGEVDLSGAAIRQPAHEFRYDVMDMTVRGKQMACVRWEFEHSIWSLDLRRSGDRVVAVKKTQLIASTSWDDTPQFSPDGKSIAFSSGRSGTPEIWVAGADGLNVRRLTFFDGLCAGTPRWSPDGKRIVFDARPPARNLPFTSSRLRVAGRSALRMPKETCRAGRETDAGFTITRGRMTRYGRFRLPAAMLFRSLGEAALKP